MYDNTNNTMVDIEKFDSDNPGKAIKLFILSIIQERIFTSNEDDVLYLSNFINNVCAIRFTQLSRLAPDFSNLNSNSINYKMLSDFISVVELQCSEFKEFKTENSVLVEIEMALNEVVLFKGYPIWIFSSKTVKDLLNSSNNSIAKYDIKLN